MHVLKKCLHGIDQLNYWVARIVSWAVVVIIAATVYEVIMRYVFNAPTIWVFEFNYLLHGPYFLLIGAYTFAVNGHVNVDIFYGRLKPRAAKQVVLSGVALDYATRIRWSLAKAQDTPVGLRDLVMDDDPIGLIEDLRE